MACDYTMGDREAGLPIAVSEFSARENLNRRAA
jgi:hypothetical protein